MQQIYLRIYINISLIMIMMINFILCKFDFSLKEKEFLFFFEIRLSKIIEKHRWFEEVQDELCEILREKLKLVSIYRSDGEINFDETIFQSLFNGLFH